MKKFYVCGMLLIVSLTVARYGTKKYNSSNSLEKQFKNLPSTEGYKVVPFKVQLEIDDMKTRTGL